MAIRAVESRDGMTARLGQAAARAARPDLVADRERGQRHQPRGLRLQLEATFDDRVGVNVPHV